MSESLGKVAPVHRVDRRVFLAALAAAPMAPFVVRSAAPALFDLESQFSVPMDWDAVGPAPIRLAFHPDAFVMVMRDLPPARLPLQRFDPARLPA